MRGRSIGVALTALLLSTLIQASGINSISGGMPNRISMNVTVPKQTQGATFGEKVNAGLQAAGSAVAHGSAIVIECGQAACALTFPDGRGYRADTARMALQPLDPSQAGVVRKGPLAQGASLLGGALPGGGIVSAAVSSVSMMSGSSSANQAATPLRVSIKPDGDIEVLDPLADGAYLLTVVVEKATGGLKDTLKTQVRAAVRQQVRIEVGFNVEAGMLKTRHDTAMNSIRNVR